jgi:hypothetical protein
MQSFSKSVLERAMVVLEGTVFPSGGVATDISDFAGEAWLRDGSLDFPNALYGVFQRRNLCRVN